MKQEFKLIKYVSRGGDGLDSCPKCGSENIAYDGDIADGELACFHCCDCGHSWQIIK